MSVISSSVRASRCCGSYGRNRSGAVVAQACPEPPERPECPHRSCRLLACRSVTSYFACAESFAARSVKMVSGTTRSQVALRTTVEARAKDLQVGDLFGGPCSWRSRSAPPTRGYTHIRSPWSPRGHCHQRAIQGIPMRASPVLCISSELSAAHLPHHSWPGDPERRFEIGRS